MTTANELRTTDRTIRYREMMMRRLREVEAERDALKAELERANRALFSCARRVTELSARLGAEKP